MENQEPIKEIKLGELLVLAGLLTRLEVDDVLSVAKFMGLPLGDLLVREKKLSRQMLKVAVRLQTLISTGMMSTELSCRTLRDIMFGRNTAEEILESFDSYSESVRSGPSRRAVSRCRLVRRSCAW